MSLDIYKRSVLKIKSETGKIPKKLQQIVARSTLEEHLCDLVVCVSYLRSKVEGSRAVL